MLLPGKHLVEIIRLDQLFINDRLFNKEVLVDVEIAVLLLNEVVLFALKHALVGGVHPLPIEDGELRHRILLASKVVQSDLLARGQVRNVERRARGRGLAQRLWLRRYEGVVGLTEFLHVVIQHV